MSDSVDLIVKKFCSEGTLPEIIVKGPHEITVIDDKSLGQYKMLKDVMDKCDEYLKQMKGQFLKLVTLDSKKLALQRGGYTVSFTKSSRAQFDYDRYLEDICGPDTVREIKEIKEGVKKLKIESPYCKLSESVSVEVERVQVDDRPEV